MRDRKEIEDVFLRVLQEDKAAPEIAQAVRDFSDSDWQELYGLAVRTRLVPIFYRRFFSFAGGCQEDFKKLYLVNLKRNLILEQELKKIILCLRERDIPVIPLKGPALARYLYADLGLRQTSNDLDLLVPYEKIDQAEAILRSSGFISKQEGSLGERPLVLKYARALHLEAKIEALDNYLLDLHWDLRGVSHDTNLKSFWENAREILLDGFKVSLPKDEDLLLYLAQCALFNLEFVRVKYLYDIHTLISKKSLDWQELVKKAKALGLKGSLYFTLALTKCFFNTAIPFESLKRLRSNFIKEAILRVWLNKQNVLYHREHIAASYLWRYVISSWIYAKDIPDCIRIIYRKIFLPVHDVGSYYLYIQRLLKPFRNIIPFCSWKEDRTPRAYRNYAGVVSVHKEIKDAEKEEMDYAQTHSPGAR